MESRWDSKCTAAPALPGDSATRDDADRYCGQPPGGARGYNLIFTGPPEMPPSTSKVCPVT